MSGIKIVHYDCDTTRVWFYGGFEVLRPSTREALQKTDIHITGQVTCLEDGNIVSYPVGRFYCNICSTWVDIDEDEHAYAVRIRPGLCYPSLVCEECTDDPMFDVNGARCAALCSDEWVGLYRYRMSRALAKQYVRKWRHNLSHRKERRTVARNASLVLARCLPDVNSNDVFKLIMSFACN